MGRHAGGGDQDAETVFSGGYGECPGLLGCAVRGIDMHFKGNFQFFQEIGRFLNDGQITVAAHDNADFLHESVSSFCCG